MNNVNLKDKSKISGRFGTISDKDYKKDVQPLMNNNNNNIMGKEDGNTDKPEYVEK